MNQLDVIRKFRSNLSTVNSWIEKTLDDNRGDAVPVGSLGFPRLEQLFPSDLLSNAKVVLISGKVPFPPLNSMGLPEFGNMEDQHFSGVTYRDTFFINEDLRYSESLHFHELVHVVQWEHLGAEKFLLAYGVSLYQSSYEDNPFEQMAYRLQTEFDRRNISSDIVEQIRKETDIIWENYAPFFEMADSGITC